MAEIKDKLLESFKALNQARERLEKDDLNAEDEQMIDRALDDFTGLRKEAEREEKRRKLDAAIASSEAETAPQTKAKEGPPDEAARQRAEAFAKYLRTGEVETKTTLVEGTDSLGGYLVPPEYLRRLVQPIADAAPALGLCTVIDVSTNSVTIPSVASEGSAAWTAEAASYNESNPTFGSLDVTVYKATRLVKLSEELVADSAFDLDGYLAGEFGRAFGALLNTALTVGTGSSQPYGIVTRVDSGYIVTAPTGNVTSLTDADGPGFLMDVKFQVKPQYRRPARWMFRDATLKVIAKLKDADHRFMFEPDMNLTAQVPGRLLGHEVVINPDVAAMAASAKSIVFGDFSYHWVLRRPEMGIRRLTELYATNGLVGFVANVRYGADLVLTAGPIAIGKNSAT